MPSTAPLKLLVVDDHEAFRQTVRQMFDSRSVQITEAGSGEEAVKVFAAADPDRVIMDLRMPGMGGIKATKAIRKLAPEARVIVISQFSDAEYREQAREAGAGRLYLAGDARPFTGLVTDLYDGGELKSRSAVSNGLLEGLSEGWSTNGQRQVEEYFAGGVSHSRRTKSYPSGSRLSEAMIVHGQLDGIFQRWHENGQMSERVEMSEGRPNGLSLAYHPSGSLKARVRLEEGKVLEQQSWADGEGLK